MAVHVTDAPNIPLAPPRASLLTRERVRSAWMFLAPMLVVVLLVAGWPLARTVWLSLTDKTLQAGDTADFVGLDNYLTYGPNPRDFDPELRGHFIDVPSTGDLLIYRASEDRFYDLFTEEPFEGVVDRAEVFGWHGVLADPLWWRSVWNTVFFSVSSVFFELVLGVIIALAINAHIPGRGMLRAAILIPWAIPTVVSAQMWAWMLNDQYGVMNELFLWAGLTTSRIAFTADSAWAMASVIAVDVWKTTPFLALLVLAALQLLPSEIYEAAKVDGIHPLRVFWRVTLPLIKPALMVAVIFRALDALRIFDLIYVLTSNSAATMSMSVYARQQLVDFQQLGYGSAASTSLFLIIAIFTVAYIWLGRVNFEK